MTELEILIRELLGPPWRTHRERATPEHIERNKRAKAIQREINERVYSKARAESSLTDCADNTDQGEKP
jgi:hypothetical protein